MGNLFIATLSQTPAKIPILLPPIFKKFASVAPRYRYPLLNVLKQFQAWGQAAKKYADDHNTTIQDAFKNNASEIIPAVEAAGNAVEQKTKGEIMGMSDEEVKALEQAKKAYNEAVAKANEAGVELTDEMTVADDCKDKAKFEAATKAINAKIAEGDKLAAKNVAIVDSTKLNIEFNRVLTDDEKAKVKVTIEGADKTLGAWNEGNTAVDVASTFVDETEYAIVVMLDDEKLYDQKLKYDINEISKLVILNSDMSQTIGSDFTLEVKLTDEDDDPIADEEIKLEVAENTTNFEKAVQLSAKTNDKGIASFTWKRTHDFKDTFSVYSISNPLVRLSKKQVEWLATKKLVSVDNTEAKTLGFGTVVEYVVTAKNEDGSIYTGSLGIKYSGAGKNSNINAEYKDASDTWTALGTTGTLYENSIALTKATTGKNGKVTFRFYTNNTAATDFAPIFFQDNDGSADNDMSSKEARVTGAKISFEKQVAKFTVTATDDNKKVATAAGAFGTTAEKAAHQYKIYEVAVEDQFGNPYRGAISIADLAVVDGKNNTTTNCAGLTMDILNTDDSSILASHTLAGTIVKWNLAIDSGNNMDTNNDASYNADNRVKDNTSKFKIKLSDGTEAQKAALAIWADDSSDGKAKVIDSDEKSFVGEELTFETRKLNELKMNAVDDKTETAAGGKLYFTVDLYDQFGDYIVAQANMDGTIRKVDGALQGDTALFDLHAKDNVDGNANTYNDNLTIGTNAQVNLSNQNATHTIYLQVTTKASSEGNWECILFSQAGTNEFDGTEIHALKEFTVKSPKLSGISLSSTANGVAAGKGIYVCDLSGDNGAETVTFKAQLNDQAGAKIATATDTVNFSVVNTGDVNVTIGINGSTELLKAGETGTYSQAATAGLSAITVNPGKNTTDVSAGKIKVEITATCPNVEGKEAKNTLYYYYNKAKSSSETITGTVIEAMDLKASDVDDRFIVVENTLGYAYIKFDHSDGTPAWNTHKITVDGNTATGQQFADVVKVGDSVEATTAANSLTLKLTTK